MSEQALIELVMWGACIALFVVVIEVITRGK